MSRISNIRSILNKLKHGDGELEKLAQEIILKCNNLHGTCRGLGRLGIDKGQLNFLTEKAKAIQAIKKYIAILCDKNYGINFPNIFIKKIDQLITEWKLCPLSNFFTTEEIKFLNEIFSNKQT